MGLLNWDGRKNILSKAQKQRYHKKVEKLQQAATELEQENGVINTDFPARTTDMNEQMVMKTAEEIHKWYVLTCFSGRTTSYHRGPSSSNWSNKFKDKPAASTSG